jgi:hypothetical protein
MPWYRILIWLKELHKPTRIVRGIRHYNQENIDVMQEEVERLAEETYAKPTEVKGVEVQMLSKNSDAVMKIIKEKYPHLLE